MNALVAAGVARERIILDPGMGFFLGSNAMASVEVLNRLPELSRHFGLPLFVSVSRKSFLQKLSGGNSGSVQHATLAAELFAVRQGARYIRTHEVRSLQEAWRVSQWLVPGSGSRQV